MHRALSLTVFPTAQFHFSAAQEYHAKSLSDLSIACMVQGDFKSARVPFLKAEAISSREAIVFNNIAHRFLQAGEGENATKCYKVSQKCGDGGVKKSARRLAELKQ